MRVVLTNRDTSRNPQSIELIDGAQVFLGQCFSYVEKAAQWQRTCNFCSPSIHLLSAQLLGQKVKVNMLKFAFWTSHHFHTQHVVSLLYFDIQWCNFTYDVMFSMTSGVPLLTVELKDLRYIVKLEVKMLDTTFHLNIMILHKYMLSMTWEWFQLITQTKENMKSLIFFTTERGDLSHKYSSSFIFWKLLKFQLYLN